MQTAYQRPELDPGPPALTVLVTGTGRGNERHTGWTIHEHSLFNVTLIETSFTLSLHSNSTYAIESKEQNDQQLEQLQKGISWHYIHLMKKKKCGERPNDGNKYK